MRKFLKLEIFLFSLIISILSYSVIFYHPLNVQAGGGFMATDVLGQADFSSSDEYSGDVGPNNTGFSYPLGTAMDTLHHRLFVSTCGARVLVYNLDTNNNLLDHTADNVLGQLDFSNDTDAGGGGNPDDTTLGCVPGASYDPVHNRLFVPSNALALRVMVYDFTGGITDGMPASYEFGEPDFETTGSFCNLNVSQNGLCNLFGGSAYDPLTDLFYIGDSGNGRVLVFDVRPSGSPNRNLCGFVSTGISNNMNASCVIGQANFTSISKTIDQTHLSNPYGIAIDPTNHRLFVDDWGGAGRVMVYDTNALANGMPASNVLGEVDFDSFDSASDLGDTPDDKSFGPTGLAYNPNTQSLYVEDDNANRVLVFDVSTITDGESAYAVLGQSDFTSNSNDTSQNGFYDTEGESDYFDPLNNRLYVSDSSNNRVM
ncbi:hypothetical protein K2P96_00705, partial [Patescibacteria group bacterium]|nr:hypothetical protein [Patescibacteria group bacterium]